MMQTTTKATKRALQSLETIYKRATQAPRYNDQSAPQSSITGLWCLQIGNDSNVTKTVVDRK